MTSRILIHIKIRCSGCLYIAVQDTVGRNRAMLKREYDEECERVAHECRLTDEEMNRAQGVFNALTNEFQEAQARVRTLETSTQQHID